MSSAQIIQIFRAAAFDPEGIERLCSAYDLAPRSYMIAIDAQQWSMRS
jgi:hypothetical protein